MWFRELVGFDESTAEEVRSRLSVDGDQMTSLVNGRQMGCGFLELPSLAELRQRTTTVGDGAGPSRYREIVGDAGALHRDPGNTGATFQAASQFNLLEMVSPDVGPDAGVAGYQNDPTQGPACAVACGAGTIYRNYFVEVNGQPGQTPQSQVDCLDGLSRFLFPGGPPAWTMSNGYAMFDRVGLERINRRLGAMGDEERDAAMAAVRIGVHHLVEVTSSPTGHLVTQAYCSALPVAYNREPALLFEPLARLVLDAAYEATLWAAALNAAETGNRTVFLTMVGGGVFGNQESWIIEAMERAFRSVPEARLDVAVVSFGRSNPVVRDLVRRV
ncbi:MAG: hypothetical protein ACK5RL_10940 [Acidimicrobiales bacterium]